MKRYNNNAFKRVTRPLSNQRYGRQRANTTNQLSKQILNKFRKKLRHKTTIV